MLIDIVILPPKSFRNKFGKIGLALKKQMPLFYTIDNKKLIPHLSLFHLRTNKVAKVSEALTFLLPSFRDFKVYPTRFNFHNIEDKYFIGGLGAKVTKDLQLLHESVVHCLYTFKSGPAFKPQKYYSPKQEYYRKNFGGNPQMFELYNPHFTLARLKILNSKQIKKLRVMLKVKFAPFQAKEIVVAQTNNNHQVIKILKTFKLKLDKHYHTQ
jgi:hypothetical protein